MKWPLMTTFFLLVSCVLYSLILLCPCTMIVCVRMRVCGKRERERHRAANGRRRSEGQASASARKRVKGTGHHKDRKNEKKMHCNQTDDYLTLYRWSSFGCWLVMVTTFSSLLLFPSFITFLSHSFALHATSGLSS